MNNITHTQSTCHTPCGIRSLMIVVSFFSMGNDDCCCGVLAIGVGVISAIAVTAVVMAASLEWRGCDDDDGTGWS